jgi:hypothetical protein
MTVLRSEFSAIVERLDGRHLAICPEVPEAVGEGHSKMAALEALRDSVAAVLTARRKAAITRAAEQASLDTIAVESSVW